MLAARMYGPNDVRLEEIPVPVLGPGELLVRVRAAAVCGTDVRMIQNGYPGICEDAPRILGHEFSGTIERTSGDTGPYREGQRVAVAPNLGCGVCSECIRGDGHLCRTYRALGIHLDGGFAEYIKIPAPAVRGGNVAILADGVSFAEGAINEALSCVCNGFEHCGIRPGDTVVIVGAGPIGIMHAKFAKMAGAGRIVVNDLSAQRLAACKALDAGFETVSEDLEEYLRDTTGGAGAEVCIAACPAPAAQAAALRMCGINGCVLFFGGVPASRQPVALDTNLIHYKQLRVTGTTRASLTQYRRTLRFIESGVLKVSDLVTSCRPLAEFSAAVDCAVRGVGLKNVILFGEH